MARKLQPVKCMERSGTWCAITRRTYEGEESTSVQTVCGRWVSLPTSSKRSVPNCQDCHDVLLVAIEAIIRSTS